MTLSARAPQSLTYRAPAFPRVLLLLLLLRPHPGRPGAPSFPPLLALLPVSTAREREGGREINGGRLLKNIVTVSVFITLTRERYLLLLFAEQAAPERERPLGGSPFGRSPGSREGERKAGLRKDRAGAARARRQTRHPGVRLLAARAADPFGGRVCTGTDCRTRVEGERQQKI